MSFRVNLGICSNNKDEAMAVLGGLKTLTEFVFKNVILEGDSKLIVDILNGVVATPWEVKNIIEKCLSLKSYFTNYKVQHVYRERNKYVDCATNEALRCMGWTRWVNNNNLLWSLRDMILNEKFEYDYNLQR